MGLVFYFFSNMTRGLKPEIVSPARRDPKFIIILRYAEIFHKSWIRQEDLAQLSDHEKREEHFHN